MKNPFGGSDDTEPDYAAFWDATEQLSAIHRTAHENPYGLLAFAMANIATHIPVESLSPIGDPMNLAVGVMGRASGAGFTTALRESERLVAPRGYGLHWWDEVSHCLYEARSHHHVFLTLDTPGVSIKDLMKGKVSTEESSRILALMDGGELPGSAAGSYRFVLRESVYFRKAGMWMFAPDQVHAGLPQRYLYAPLWGPRGDATRGAPELTLPDQWSSGAAALPSAAIEEAQEVERGHLSFADEMLLRTKFKVSVLLAAVHSRPEPTDMDWELSEVVARLTQRLSRKNFEHASALRDKKEAER